MLFFHKKKKEVKDFDREHLEPVLRSSICTGETCAGFADRKNGHFTEVMMIRDQSDLDEFMELYGIEEVPRTIY